MFHKHTVHIVHRERLSHSDGREFYKLKIILFLWGFHMTFFYIWVPSPSLPRFFLTSLPTQFYDHLLPVLKTKQNLQSSFCLLVGMGLPWSVVDLPSVTWLKKIKFSFPGSYQLQIALWLGIGHCAHPFSVLGFCLVWACTGLCLLPQSLTSSALMSLANTAIYIKLPTISGP